MTTRSFLAATLLAAALGACGGGGDGGSATAPPDDHTVVGAASLVFTPATLTVARGDSVTWVFRGVAHNVFFDAAAGAPADIGGQNANVSVRRAFPSAGTYHYGCHIHPQMRGTVVVQ